ncbi:thioredoxin family protein [Thermoanaerobacterium xylanolyticum]|uniref:thioredoxin family protein n=1 Tax=Thermoanaerobacterium xylanolyticum TaxID=29329 RepID=UPI0001FAEFD9|nr:thioredoxin domain-containing protein [Thermoanaerobacterium xylanolyticum]
MDNNNLFELTIKNFRNLIANSDKPLFIHFKSPWNKSCFEVTTIMRKLTQEYRDKVVFGEVNCDIEAEIAAWMRIINMSTVIFFINGEQVARLVGLREKTEYTFMLESSLIGDKNRDCISERFRDTFSDTWVSTDRLGRNISTFNDVGGIRKDKYIAMFYFINYGSEGLCGPYDVTKIMEKNPCAIDSDESPPWGPYWHPHHWGEPLFGYYLNQDEYVIRKHSQMLSDAGVDVIIFDVSNFQPGNPPQAYFKDTFIKIMDIFTAIRNEGKRTPCVAFLFNFWAGPYGVYEIYKDVYSKGLYKDLWFIWDGKPLILYDKEKIGEDRKEILDFFTFRRPMPDYFYGPLAPDQWSWLEVYPQHGFYSSREPEKIEEVSVSVAQNAVPDGRGGWTLGCMSERDKNGRFVAHGRSFHNGRYPERFTPEYGYNFAEQWKRALELDPKIIFVTGWNEWIAGRMPGFLHYSAPNVFVDQFDHEFSRDIEPMKGGYVDNYYCQFVNYARKFKGARPIPTAGLPKTIVIDGNFDEWIDVQPEYRDDIGDALSRNYPGFGSAGPYIDDTGRNDFELMKVSRDDNYIYFYVKTVKDITPWTDSDWMMLLLKTDPQKPNWEGVNFIVNRRVMGPETTVLEVSKGGWDWEIAEDEIHYWILG